MGQSGFFFDLTTGRITAFAANWSDAETYTVPAGQGVCRCGEVILLRDDQPPDEWFVADPATGRHRRMLPEEARRVKAEKARADLEVRIEMHEARAEAAGRAGLTDRQAEHRAILDGLKVQLAAAAAGEGAG